MRLELIQKVLKERQIKFDYTEEDGCGSIDLINKGLPYHIWEYEDGGVYGVETNVFHVGRSIDMEGDYEETIAEELKNWLPG